jgi:AAA15 family ATPase/GTPase
MPMIRKITLKNFKRFKDVQFKVPGRLVIAGPNNTGKTTLLQAIAAWAFGLSKWLEKGAGSNPRQHRFPWQELERAQFGAVALRSFDLLWHNR